jgi:hypothetical protein
MTAITLESDSGHGPPVIDIATSVPVQKPFKTLENSIHAWRLTAYSLKHSVDYFPNCLKAPTSKPLTPNHSNAR